MNKLKLFLISVLLSIIMCFPVGNYVITLIVTDLNPKLTKIGIAKSRWQYQLGSNPAGWDGHFLGDYVEYSCINRNGVLQKDSDKVVGGVALC